MTKKSLIIILGVLLVSGLIVWFLIWRYASGQVTITLNQPEGYVVIDGVTKPTPHSGRYKSGRKDVLIGAVGYLEQKKTVKVPYLGKREIALVLDRKLIYEEDAQPILDKYPWANDLPVTNDKFKINFPNADGIFAVELFAVLNRADQRDEYQGQLTDYGQAAIEFFRSKGVKPKDLKIEWQPETPQNLNYY